MEEIPYGYILSIGGEHELLSIKASIATRSENVREMEYKGIYRLDIPLSSEPKRGIEDIMLNKKARSLALCKFSIGTFISKSCSNGNTIGELIVNTLYGNSSTYIIFNDGRGRMVK